jgi:hypothetical protein
VLLGYGKGQPGATILGTVGRRGISKVCLKEGKFGAICEWASAPPRIALVTKSPGGPDDLSQRLRAEVSHQREVQAHECRSRRLREGRESDQERSCLSAYSLAFLLLTTSSKHHPAATTGSSIAASSAALRSSSRPRARVEAARTRSSNLSCCICLFSLSVASATRRDAI